MAGLTLVEMLPKIPGGPNCCARPMSAKQESRANEIRSPLKAEHLQAVTYVDCEIQQWRVV